MKQRVTICAGEGVVEDRDRWRRMGETYAQQWDEIDDTAAHSQLSSKTMTDTRDLFHHSHLFIPENTMKLTSSASEQNVYFTYVCLVSGIKPNENVDPDCGFNRPSFHCANAPNEELTPEDEPIQVERSKALHELIESHRKEDKDPEEKPNTETNSSTPYPATTSGEESEHFEDEDCNFISCDSPSILKLTKMKWLTEDQEGSPDSSLSLSPASSSVCSTCSKDSESIRCESFGDKYLSTIIRLDKEHNMFGLSNIAIVGTKPSKMKRRDDDRAIFHQTAIVQICCGKRCCRYKSNTDLPSSLKCGGCRGCCIDPSCSLSVGTSRPPIDPPCSPSCTACPKGKCICKVPILPPKCMVDCGKCFGMKVSLNRKPKYDEQTPIELTPRASSVLQKPMAARSCHHLPRCIPPSSCFPYLMPCYWPAPSSAPCSVPARCFHNPPCPPPRKHQCPLPPGLSGACPRDKKCVDNSKKTKCMNISCLGAKNNPNLTDESLDNGKKKKIKKHHITCECAVPTCATCFVSRPEKRTTADDTTDILPIKALKKNNL